MDYNFDKAAFASTMIRRRDREITLTDAFKFDWITLFIVASFRYTDAVLSETRWQEVPAEYLDQVGVEVLQ